MTRFRLFAVLALVAVLTAAVLAARGLAGSASGMVADAGTVVPTAAVTRGDIALTVRMKGDLRASRQVGLIAPAVGTTLRILTMIDTGTVVEAGDQIMTFDPADQQYALEQAESQLLEAEQEIRKRKADIAAQAATDKVTLLAAQFDVRRAELDARADAQLIGANEYKIRRASLGEARRRLEQVEKDVGSRTVTSEASLKVLQEKLNRTSLDADRARDAMNNLMLTATITGIVSIRENRDASGGIFYSGMQLPEYRVGDDVRAGRPVADLFDVSTMEIKARVNEQERANIDVGQQAVITAHATPGVEFPATVTAVAGMGVADRTAGPLRQFDVTLEVARPDARMRPGSSVEVVVHGETVTGVLTLPRQAVFEEEGKSIVFVPSPDERGRFDAVPVNIVHRSETLVAVEGLDEGTEVALVNPGSVRDAVAGPASPAAVGVGK
jgi:multidrug resistance efflux pump